ncbi:MAG: fluoride efflux transporter CrcB [Planctomycetales bacterium]|nr:fluoride efflux transporter CrcB [Planctomycetales bacterium]
MKHIFFIAIGGAFGAVGRFLATEFVQRKVAIGFPIGTLTVNVVGCFLIGLLLQFENQSQWLTSSHRTLLVTGFLGAFTTFSTFGHDTVRYAQASLPLAVLNIGTNVILGIAAVAFGIICARILGPS